MTAKEHVLKIYPTAWVSAFSYGGKPLWSLKIHHEDGYCCWDTVYVEDYTPERVWEQAWAKIQKDMLKRLSE